MVSPYIWQEIIIDNKGKLKGTPTIQKMPYIILPLATNLSHEMVVPHSNSNETLNSMSISSFHPDYAYPYSSLNLKNKTSISITKWNRKKDCT